MSLFITNISLFNPINFFAILYHISLANLVVEVGTRFSHQKNTPPPKKKKTKNKKTKTKQKQTRTTNLSELTKT